MVGQFSITTKMGEERYGGQNIISNRMVFFFSFPLQLNGQSSGSSSDDSDERDALIPATNTAKMASIRPPRGISTDYNHNQEIVLATKKRKPFFVEQGIREEETDGGNVVDHSVNKVLILNQNRITKFPCTIGEANELLLRQLVTVKFSFNSSLPRKKSTVDYNGNYDELPLICAEDLRVPSINRMLPVFEGREVPRSRSCDDRQTIERELELTALSEEVPKSEQFDKSVQILYQKYEQRGQQGLGTMIVHQFITVAELSPTKGHAAKLCQLCHTPLRSFATIKCVHCDFKCHAHCQKRVSTNWGGEGELFKSKDEPRKC